jgi:hypothetical protein
MQQTQRPHLKNWDDSSRSLECANSINLATVEKLIYDCGHHRHDKKLCAGVSPMIRMLQSSAVKSWANAACASVPVLLIEDGAQYLPVHAFQTN